MKNVSVIILIKINDLKFFLNECLQFVNCIEINAFEDTVMLSEEKICKISNLKTFNYHLIKIKMNYIAFKSLKYQLTR